MESATIAVYTISTCPQIDEFKITAGDSKNIPERKVAFFAEKRLQATQKIMTPAIKSRIIAGSFTRISF